MDRQKLLKFPPFSAVLAAALLTFATTGARAESVTVAVASNFARPAHDIAAQFTSQTGRDVRIVPGSSGKLYAQIANGAPYDLFLSADRRFPERLEQEARIVPGSRFTYAIGRLVLWSRDEELDGADCVAALADLGGRKLAVANPELAPYGQAAIDWLEEAGLLTLVSGNLVYGENVAQTLQFAAAGGARLAFVAASQLHLLDAAIATCSVPLSAPAGAALDQQAVQLRAGRAAAGFLQFLGSETARDIIAGYGYALPAPR